MGEKSDSRGVQSDRKQLSFLADFQQLVEKKRSGLLEILMVVCYGGVENGYLCTFDKSALNINRPLQPKIILYGRSNFTLPIYGSRIPAFKGENSWSLVISLPRSRGRGP